jgi:hypothetical protein
MTEGVIMARTVQELINDLQEIEDKNQPIIFQYYIAEHFIDPETNDNLEPERFEKVADEMNEKDYLWDDIFEEIAEAVNSLESEDDNE